MLQSWENSLWPMSPTEAVEYRRRKLEEFDGQCTPKLFTWPKDIWSELFKNKFPSTYRTAPKIFLFLVGNGCSPFMAGTWILSHHALLTYDRRDQLAKARIKTLIRIYSKMIVKDESLYSRTNHCIPMHFFECENKKIQYGFYSMMITVCPIDTIGNKLPNFSS